MIPKILHQVAPKDRTRWHPMWERCHPTWKNVLTDFEHKLWSDEDEITQFVKDHYPDYYQLFLDFPVHIIRCDFIRFCLLHHFGGVYVDMDMYCYKNFYDELTNPVMIVEAPYGEEFLESSLMVSEPNHQFWIDCMEASKKQFYSDVIKREIKIPFNDNLPTQYIIQSVAGPALICKVWREWLNKNDIKTLPGVLYNNHGMSYHPNFRTRHMMTGMWGKEAINRLEEQANDSNLKKYLSSIYIKEVSQFAKLNNVTVETFDFYKDYTNGCFMKDNVIDYNISNKSNDLNLNGNDVYC